MAEGWAHALSARARADGDDELSAILAGVPDGVLSMTGGFPNPATFASGVLGEIAARLDRTEAAVRQLLVRARAHVQEKRPRYPLDDGARKGIAENFLPRCTGGAPRPRPAWLPPGAACAPTGGGWGARVREGAGDRGVGAAFDGFGGEQQERALDLLRPGGRIVSVIAPPGPREHVEPHYIFVRPSGYDLAEMSDLIADGGLKPHVEETFPLERAAEAMQRLQDGHVRGKLVLEIG